MENNQSNSNFSSFQTEIAFWKGMNIDGDQSPKSLQNEQATGEFCQEGIKMEESSSLKDKNLRKERNGHSSNSLTQTLEGNHQFNQVDAERKGYQSLEEEKSNPYFATEGSKNSQDIDRSLSKMREIDEPITQSLINIIEQIKAHEIENFSDYQRLNEYEKHFSSLMNEYWLKIFDEKNESKEDMKALEILTQDIIEQIRIKFIRVALVSSDPKELLFHDISLITEESITKRYRQLARCFHPDKSSFFFKKNQHLADQLFSVIQGCKEDLLQIIEKESAMKGKFAFYEEKGHQYWMISQEYKEAIADNWDKLCILAKESLRNLSQEDLKTLRLIQIGLARESYRVCCKIADKIKNFKKQVQLRGSIALCFYSENQYLEAQLYALTAIQLILNHPYAVQEDLNQAIKILNKVNSASAPVQAEKNEIYFQTRVDTLAIPQKNEGIVMISSKPIAQLSFLEKIGIQNTIRQELAVVASELTLKGDRSLVKYQCPLEEILRAKKSARRHKVAGSLAMTSGVTVGGAAVVTASVQIIHTLSVITAGITAGPILSLLAGLATIGLGIWGGKGLWKKGNSLLEQPLIREKLNEMMGQALKYYDDGKYNEFIAELSKEFKPGTCLFTLKSPRDIICSRNIIENLLKYGFRPDGIAYLLNLIGEVLLSGKISIPGVSKKDLTDMAKKLFYGSLDEALENSAKKLDETIHELRCNTLKSVSNWLQDLILLKDYTQIAKEHINDSQEMPFKARLNEMRYIANMNIAVIRILDGEIDFAIEIIKDVQNLIRNNYSFLSKSQTRLEALEDFLWAVSGQNLNDTDSEESLKIHAISMEHPEEKDDREMIDQALKRPNLSEEEKMNLYIQQAAYYEKNALKKAKTNFLYSLRRWQSAQKGYQKSLEINPHEPKSAFGFARCLLNLSKYEQVLTFLSQNPNLSSLIEYWMIGSIAHYEQRNYKEAESFIVEALTRDPWNVEACKQRSLIQRLKQNTLIDKFQIYSQSKLEGREDHLVQLSNTRSLDETQHYKILSFDGGGVRGIMQTLFTSELERKLKVPISSLFQMVSGTSTGAVIAAGLTVPITTDFDRFGQIRPKYSAFDILNLYCTEAKNIFTFESWDILPGNIKLMVRPKYTNYGRQKIFSKYFGQLELNQALIKLVIPAVQEENLSHPYLFTSDDDQDCFHYRTFFEALMATTAAPTYFPAYKILEQGTFIDGGVTTNNPSMVAYDEAIRCKIPKEKIFALSMGTGSFLPDPSNFDLYRGQLFWSRNLHEVTLTAQEGSTDILMFNHLGNKYQRWQVYLEEPISFDDYREETLYTLLDIGNHHIEDMYASDDNTLNKLLEFLEQEKPL